MARYKFYTADVFTDVVFGGNPLAVLPDARGLNDAQMQAVAREFNLSETAFVFPPAEPRHTRRLRIFTPAMELPFAGHPTIGTAHVLASIGEIALAGQATEIVFEEGVGPVGISITVEQGRPSLTYLTAAQLPEFGPPPPEPAALAKVLSLSEDEFLVGKWCSAAASCGVPFLFMPVRDRAVLARAALNREHWNHYLQGFWAPQLYVLCFEPEQSGSDLRARMFAPSMGVEEDPATGAAATALAGYLGVRDSRSDGVLRWTVEQGFEMNRPSLLYLEAEKQAERIVGVRVGGHSIMVSEGTITVPDA